MYIYIYTHTHTETHTYKLMHLERLGRLRVHIVSKSG